MATQEETQMKAISDLSDQALQHYEGLRKEHERTKLECKQFKQERDEALQKLEDFERVSHMVLREVSSMQENLEVEKTCRQTVEALATKLNRQNHSLKRKSMMYMAHLDSTVIAEINLNEDEDDQQEEEPSICSSAYCQRVISELRNKVELALEDKKQLAIDLETTKDQLRKTRDQLLQEKHDNTVLIAETLQQKKLLGKYNRVSRYAVEEYEALQADLELEKGLRAEAENFAHKMLVEQKKLKRQSQALMQSVSPSEALQNALKEITSLTHTLEKQRLEHQQQLKHLESELQGSELKKQLVALERKAILLEEDRKECMEKCSRAETEAKDLRFTVEELQKKLKQMTNPVPVPVPPPPPPPPPPPLPPPPSASINPLSSLLSMLRKKKDMNPEIPLVEKDLPAKEPEKDIQQQAVTEMMERIKKGIQLRPVGQTSNRAKLLQRERIPSGSAIQELKGILSSVKRPSPCHSPSTKPSSAEPQSELQKILQKRRGALEAAKDSVSFPSSVLDLNRVKHTHIGAGHSANNLTEQH